MKGGLFALAFISALAISTTAQDNDDETVALILGGYWESSLHPVLNSMELFGCDGTGKTDSFYLDDFDYRIYLTSAKYMEENDRIMICGGYRCNYQNNICGVGKTCETWNPELGWKSAGTLKRPKWAHIMPMVKNINKTSDNLVPMVMGLNKFTEIWDEDNGNWTEYLELRDSFWYSIGCLIEYEGKIYSMRDKVVELDPETWTFNNLADVPTNHQNDGKCASVTIDGDMGLMTRFGYFFNLRTKEWVERAHPPFHHSGTQTPNSMFNFRGKPTIFGVPVCDSTGEICVDVGVIQYNPETDHWDTLGEMLQPRRFHEVVEVPKSFCNRYREIHNPPARDPAALVIGGYQGGLEEPTINSVELFGCTGTGVASKELNPYPLKVYLNDGVYFEDTTKGHRVLVCGGYACNNGSCTITDKCFSWKPNNGDKWEEEEPLVRPRWAHIMAMAPNRNRPNDDSKVPLVVGLTQTTEIYDEGYGDWSEYFGIEYRSLFSINCFFQFKDNILAMRDEVLMLDPRDWKHENLDDNVPPMHQHTGRCAGVVIDGDPGMMTRYGYWFNLKKRTWHAKRAPPYVQGVPAVNSLHTFRGRPTIFGAVECDGNGENCAKTAVYQYNPEDDEWINLGSLIHTREFHTVIEVPGEICDEFLTTSTTTLESTTFTVTTTNGDNTTSNNPPMTTSSADATHVGSLFVTVFLMALKTLC